jgi:Leucine-rich repeat (LRR) protein
MYWECIIKNKETFNNLLDNIINNNITKIELELTNNKVCKYFKKPHEEFNNLTELKILIDNKIKLDNYKKLNIFYLTKLTKLDLSSIRKNYLNPEIGNLTNLINLNLSYNYLSELPKEISKLTKLNVLNLSYNNFTKIDDTLYTLTNLTKLNLNNNLLSELKIDNIMPNLTKLCLEENNIETINDNIINLTNLKSLKLFNNELENPLFINKLYNLTTLEKLDLCENFINIITDDISKLQNIKILNFKNCDINHISNNMSLLTKLTDLNISNNIMTDLFEGIGQLQNLTYLNISNCENLLRIPDSFEQIRINIDLVLYNTPNLVFTNPIFNVFFNIDYDDNFADDIKLTTYQDSENIHNSSIQKSVRNNIAILLQDNYDISKSDLHNELINTNFLSLIELNSVIDGIYGDDLFGQNITYFMIFTKVWGRIINNSNKNELLKRLREEIYDSINLCFVGKITRLINSLSGFYDDIKIEISINEQISNIIISYLKGRELDNNLKSELFNILTERGFNKEDIDKWLNN